MATPLSHPDPEEVGRSVARIRKGYARIMNLQAHLNMLCVRMKVELETAMTPEHREQRGGTPVVARVPPSRSDTTRLIKHVEQIDEAQRTQATAIAGIQRDISKLVDVVEDYCRTMVRGKLSYGRATDRWSGSR